MENQQEQREEERHQSRMSEYYIAISDYVKTLPKLYAEVHDKTSMSVNNSTKFIISSYENLCDKLKEIKDKIY